jgi:hypothetical protein
MDGHMEFDIIQPSFGDAGAGTQPKQPQAPPGAPS